MKTQKYSLSQHSIETIVAWVNAGEIAIPEIQRPFVWESSKVRDFMDSLYQGYPVGYIISWRNPNIQLKDGTFSAGKKILIDGQQRITALTAAILGQYVINKTYQRVKIKISFHPILERFEVQNSAILKDKTWLPDISELLNGQTSILKVIRKYLELNPQADEEIIENSITSLSNITRKQIGIIELSSDLEIDTVTEIFIRINSKGVVLSQADFAMSKIASNIEYKGDELRKAIDYFCHLATAPEFYSHLLDYDKAFTSTEFFQKMSWLRIEHDNIYIPDYTDMIRVAFTVQFNRGRLADLVSLLSGRNFETRIFEETIAQTSFANLQTGILQFMNETNFKRFLLIIKSAGFISPKLIRSKNALNFAYILYLKLRILDVNQVLIEKYVRRWFVYSILTGRYSSSPESTFDFDIKQISTRPFSEYLTEKENGELSDAFWYVALPQHLDTAIISSPFFHVFLAAQVKAQDKGFLSKDIFVGDLISLRGDIHHLFPKDYLHKNGLDKNKYNQIANYVYMQSEINIKIGNLPPQQYFTNIIAQFHTQNNQISGLVSEEELMDNLHRNCVPAEIQNMSVTDFDDFLHARRRLMATKLKNYYFSL